MFLIASKPFSVVGPEGKVDFPEGVSKDPPDWLKHHKAYLEAMGAQITEAPPASWVDPVVAEAKAKEMEAAELASLRETVELQKMDIEDQKNRLTETLETIGKLTKDLQDAVERAEAAEGELVVVKASLEDTAQKGKK